eukprot:447977-Pleurochrysis_carterae.AAC.1
MHGHDAVPDEPMTCCTPSTTARVTKATLMRIKTSGQPLGISRARGRRRFVSAEFERARAEALRAVTARRGRRRQRRIEISFSRRGRVSGHADGRLGRRLNRCAWCGSRVVARRGW